MVEEEECGGGGNDEDNKKNASCNIQPATNRNNNS